jgi:hypothetical protein
VKRFAIIIAAAALFAACGSSGKAVNLTDGTATLVASEPTAVAATPIVATPTAPPTATATPSPAPLSADRYPACRLVPGLVSTQARQSLTAPSTVPESIALFLGTWEGRWGPAAADASALVVQEVTESTARALYVYDGQVGPMKLAASTAMLERRENPTLTWTLSSDGASLNGVRNQVGTISRVTMTRCNPGTAAADAGTRLAPAEAVPRCKFVPPFVAPESLITNVPAAALPPQLAGLAGAWEGRFSDVTSWESVLVVSSLAATQATVLYTFAGSAETKVFQVRNNSLQFRATGVSFDWLLSADGSSLLGVYSAPGYNLKVTMTRCSP